jgi:hypothetical protein
MFCCFWVVVVVVVAAAVVFVLWGKFAGGSHTMQNLTQCASCTSWFLVVRSECRPSWRSPVLDWNKGWRARQSASEAPESVAGESEEPPAEDPWQKWQDARASAQEGWSNDQGSDQEQYQNPPCDDWGSWQGWQEPDADQDDSQGHVWGWGARGSWQGQ